MSRTKTCLIVDDSRMIRRVAGRIVSDMGFKTEDAANGQEALDACMVEMPDVVLLDWNMPVLNGYDFLTALRNLPGGSEPVVLFCTSERDIEKIVQALAAGANEYIMKPFDSAIIESKFQLAGLM